MSIKEFIFCITKKWTHWQIFSKMLPTFHEHFRVAASIILFVFFLARSIFLKTKIEPYSNVLGEIILSLNRFNLIICRKDQAFSNWFFVNLVYLNGLRTSSSKLYKLIGWDLVQMSKKSIWNVTKPLKKCWILRFMMVRWRKFSCNRPLQSLGRFCMMSVILVKFLSYFGKKSVK